MSVPTISIVMAARNYAQYLPIAIDSVLQQTRTDWELIIVDDGSTDATPEVAKRYSADTRIRYHRTDRLGQSRAKNLGLHLSRGRLTAFLDADDVWLPNKLERQVAVFDANPRVGVVYTLRELIDEAGKLLPNQPVASMPSGQVFDQMFVQNFVCFSSVMVRRVLFDQVGLFNADLELAVDFDLWVRIARVTEFDGVPERLVQYRTGHGNLSQKLADRVLTAFTIMRRSLRRGDTPSSTQAFASTARTMAWVYRKTLPGESIRWYLWSLRWPYDRWHSLKGLIAATGHWLRGTSLPLAAENHPANF